PIVIDAKNNLLSGHHRLEAHRKLGRESIECKQVSLSELENELVQIDENLINNELTIIEKSEHLIKRESILEQLGLRSEIGENQYTSRGGVNLVTTKTLSDQLGIAERKYQRIKQVHKIDPDAREILKETDVSNNLNGLLLIERLKDDQIQIEVAKRVTDDNSRNVKGLIKEIQKEIKQGEILKHLDDFKNSQQEGIQLYHGDFREVGQQIRDQSIDLIFTDPPYIDEDSLDLYQGLSELGNRVLKDDGSCLCYVTQTMLHQVLNVMSENLDYYWIISIKHGGNNGRHGRGIFVEWKPILWFVKGEKKRSSDFVADFVYSTPPEKILHRWEQSTKEAEYYISHLSSVGEIVLDPMMGTGTTGVASLSCSRNFVGIEKEKSTFDIARGRISEMDLF
ncbi:hypothetical protein CMK14_01980, partial [Candidatus Poribacteria bacterium]|nr:hypothetical protein [Candidatus Poribacteria bacterium]